MITWPLKTWLGLFYYALVPVAQFGKIDNPFMHLMNTDNSGIAFFYSIYNSTFVLIGTISLFFNKNKTIQSYKYLLGFMFLMVMILPLNTILMAFTTPSLRVMFLFNFVTLLVVAKNLDEITAIDFQWRKVGVVFTTIFLVLTILCVSLDVISLDSNFTIVISIMFVLALLNIYLLNRRINFTPWIAVLETLVFATLVISGQHMNDYEDNINKDFIKYYQNMDEDLLYRQYINYKEFAPSGASDLNQNITQHYEFMGMYTYDSTFENPLIEFITWTESDMTEHSFNISNPNLFKLLGVKYVGISDYETLDTINEYEYAYDLNHIHMYKIKDYNHIGHTFSKFVLKEDIIDNIDVNAFDWNNTLIVNEDLYSIVKDYPESDKNQLIIQEQISNNNFNATIYCNADEVLFIAIPYDEGWTIKIDGIEAKIYNVDGGFIGIPLTQGDHYIEAWYMPQGFKAGAIVTLAGGALLLVLIWNDIRINKRRKLEQDSLHSIE